VRAYVTLDSVNNLRRSSCLFPGFLLLSLLFYFALRVTNLTIRQFLSTR